MFTQTVSFGLLSTLMPEAILYQGYCEHHFTKGSLYSQSCLICTGHNTGKGMTNTIAAHPPSEQLVEHVMMDFIELTPCEGKKYCLVMADMWS